MTAPFILFSLVGLGFFYLQNLWFFPHVHLRLLALLIFYVGLRPSLSTAAYLGAALGLLQDSYATTPFGLHLGASLALVATARFLRRRLQLQKVSSQVLASLGALILQEGCFQVSLFVLGFHSFFLRDLLSFRYMEILGTAALGPLMNHLVLGLEKFLRRLGFRAIRETNPIQPH